MAEVQKEKEKGMAKRETKETGDLERRRVRSPWEEMERWFEESFPRPFLPQRLFGHFGLPEMYGPFGTVSLQADIFEDGNDVVVKAEIPGLRKEDIDINIRENMLTISGEKKSEEKVERKDYYRFERSFGSFTRNFHLPSEIEPEKAQATFNDGVLEIRIPKSEAARERVKKIEIH